MNYISGIFQRMSENLVIIPTYNEKENIENIIRKVFSLQLSFDILVVDDSSPDGTAVIVKKMMKEFDRLHLEVRQKKRRTRQGLCATVSNGHSKGNTNTFMKWTPICHTIPMICPV